MKELTLKSLSSTKNFFDKSRPLSWSAVWLFETDRERWYNKYVLGEKEKPTKEMEFGKVVGEKLASDPLFMPHVVRYDTFELPLTCMFDGIPLIGYIDTSKLDLKKHREYKTGKKPWTQKRADEHGQVTMYSLMLFILYKIEPEDLEWHLDWMPTIDVEPDHDSLDSFLNSKSKTTIGFVDQKDVRSFLTKRTRTDIVRFGARIRRIYKEMEAYALNHE